MKHKTAFNAGDTIEIHIVGKISSHDTSNIVDEVNKLIKKAEGAGKKIKVLANYTHAGKHNVHHHGILEHLFHGYNFHKIAAYNLDKIPANILTELIKLKGFQEKFRLFRTRDEAELWLTER